MRAAQPDRPADRSPHGGRVAGTGQPRAEPATSPPRGARRRAGAGRRGDAPEGLRELVAACLAKDPALRPSADQIAARTRTDAADPWLPPELLAELGRLAARRLAAPTPAAAPEAQRSVPPGGPPAEAARPPPEAVAGSRRRRGGARHGGHGHGPGPAGRRREGAGGGRHARGVTERRAGRARGVDRCVGGRGRGRSGVSAADAAAGGRPGRSGRSRRLVHRHRRRAPVRGARGAGRWCPPGRTRWSWARAG